MKTQIDLVLLALEALIGIGSEAMLKAAEALGIEALINDRVALWRLRQSNPMRKGSGGRKKLDIEEARSLVLISCHLACAHQTTIRDAVNALEQLSAQNRPPHHSPILGDYLDNFTNTYEERMAAEQMTPEAIAHIALKLLIELLFYSGPQGPRRLWITLLNCGIASENAGSEKSQRPQASPSPSAKMKPAAQKGDQWIGSEHSPNEP